MLAQKSSRIDNMVDEGLYVESIFETSTCLEDWIGHLAQSELLLFVNSNDMIKISDYIYHVYVPI